MKTTSTISVGTVTPSAPPLFDAHCHLQDKRLAPLLNDAMNRAIQAGVTDLMCCGTREADWPDVIDIAARFINVRISFGLHPWYVADRTATWLDTLRGLLKDHPSAIGEIGLDHALDLQTFAAQEEAFLAQLTLAVELERPVSVHCRRAWGRIMELLDDHGWPPHGILFHSYSGGPELVPALVRRHASFSFSGAITHDQNVRGREAVAIIPEDRLLIETDSPDIMPAIPSLKPESKHHFLLRRHDPVNEPANLQYVASAIADLRHWSLDQTGAITRKNAEAFFAHDG